MLRNFYFILFFNFFLIFFNFFKIFSKTNFIYIINFFYLNFTVPFCLLCWAAPYNLLQDGCEFSQPLQKVWSVAKF